MTPPPPDPPTPVPAPAAPEPPAQRQTQLALAAVLVVLLGLLVARGYGTRFGARPTELVATRYDLNRVDPVELEQIPGVGPKLARAIADHRKEKGPFRSVDDLRAVKGLGPATLDKVRPYVRVDADAPPGPTASLDPDPPLPDRKSPDRKPLTARGVAPDTKADEPPAPRAGGTGRKLQPGDRPVNVNVASVDELQQLPGVGPVTARAIASARAERPFRALADLDRVKGIGPKTLDKLRPFVVVE